MFQIVVLFFIPLLQLEFIAAEVGLPSDNDSTNSLTRIVNGFPATSIVPHQVSFRRFDSHFCGGSIINSRWILTAAHCIVYYPSEVTAVVGTIYLDQGGDEYKINQTVVHESYKPTVIFNDIALVKVDREFDQGKGYGPIALCDKFTHADTPMRLNGWGLTTTSGVGTLPNNLQSLDTKTIPVLRCFVDAILGSLNPTNLEKAICTVNEKGTGACRGDSGGGLVDKSSGQLCGIVSWGKPCAKGQPDVFTRVYSYRDWIDKVLKKYE